MCVCVKKRKGRVVKLYLYSIVMYSICGQRLYNAHITVRNRRQICKGYIEHSLPYSRQTLPATHTHKRTHLLYNSLPPGLPTELLVMLYDPLFTIRQYNKERKSNLSRRGTIIIGEIA